ncbi:S-layer homology domain-containing protein [Bacillota bacterium LX-D]|nr:S-layer homology domain-containing protein [Bacillota bacterium LX-D]
MRLKILISILTLICFLNTSPAAFAALPEYSGSKEAAQILKQIKFSDITNHWSKAAVQNMAAQGIIRGVGNSKFAPNRALTKEQAIILLVKAVGLGPKAEAAALANKGQNQTKLSPSQQAYLDTAVSGKILTSDERTALESSYQKPAQRQETAYWLAKALGLEPVYSVDQKLVYGFNDAGDFNSRYIPYIEKMLQEKYAAGFNSSQFKPKSSITRGEMAALLSKVSDKLAAKRGETLEKGHVVSKSTGWNGIYQQIVVTIKTDEGHLFNLKLEKNVSEVVVLKKGVFGTSSLLAKNDCIVFYQKGQKIDFIQVKPESKTSLSGQLKSLDLNNNKLVISDWEGEDYTFSIGSGATVIVANRPAGLNDLVLGQEVSLNLNGSTVSQITGTLEPATSGSTSSPRSGVVTGRVKSVDGNSILLLTDSGEQEKYWLKDDLDSDEVQIGDRVKLYFSDLASKEADNFQVASQAGKVVRIVKGELEQVYASAPKIALSGVQEFFYGQWFAVDGFDLLNLAADAEIYANGENITLEELGKYYQGDDVYLAFTSDLGAQEGIKIVVKKGAAETYSDYIDDVNYANNSLDLDREAKRFTLGPQTIIMRAGKIVDADDLEEDQQVIIESNDYDDEEIPVLAVVNQYYPQKLQLYKGRIDDIDEDEYSLDYYSEFTDNEWDDESSSSKNVDLEYDNDTDILDATQSPAAEVTPKEFAESRWSDDYDSSYYIYSLIEDDKTLAMRIFDTSGQRDNVLKTTAAKVTALDYDDETIDLDWVVDWSARYSAWQENDYSLSLDLQNTMLYKDGELIDLREIKAGDTVYVIHDQQQGYFLFVQ